MSMEHSRKKSCKQCRVAKTRCSLDAPTCSRCGKKRLACQYEHQNRQLGRSASVHVSMFHSWLMETNTVTHNNPAEAGQLILDMPAPADQTLLELGTSPGTLPERINRLGPMEWSSDSQPASITEDISANWEPMSGNDLDTLQPHTEKDDTCSFDPPSSDSTQDNGNGSIAPNRIIPLIAEDGASVMPASALAIMQNTEPYSESWQALGNIPAMLPNILNRKEPSKMWEITAMNYIWATVKSYLVDFNQSCLPPFVHNSCLLNGTPSSEKGFSNLPEPLANCKGILPLYSQQTAGSRFLVLKTTFQEVTRLNDEVGSRCDIESRLWALQALVMYVIVLASDQGRCNLLSITARIAMGEMARKIATESGYFSTSEEMGNFPGWDEWRIVESIRRTLLLLHIMDKVVDFNVGKPAITSCGEFDKIPLTCSKAMWEAETAASWEVEYKEYLSTRKGKRMAKFGDLRRSSNLDVNSVDRDLKEDLASWAKNIDSFGAMLLSICH